MKFPKWQGNQRASALLKEYRLCAFSVELKPMQGGKVLKSGSKDIQYKKLPDISWPSLALIVLLLTSIIGFRAIPWSWAAETTMVVYQQKDGKVFGLETSLDIFNNPRFDGQKMIAPFSEGSYEFAVYNDASGVSLPYALEIKSENPDNIPIAISLEKNGEYIFGGADISDMQYLTALNLSETFLGGKMTDLYTLRWKWITKNDETDTVLGKDGTQLYTLIITANGTIEEVDSGGGGSIIKPSEPEQQEDPIEPINPEQQEEPTNPDETEFEPTIPGEQNKDAGANPEKEHNLAGVGTGYTSYLNVLVIIMISCMAVLVILSILKRGKNDDDSKKGPENM